MNDLKQRLARVLRTARMRKGLTQEAVAERAGVTTETVSNTERTQSLVTLDVFLRLAVVLDIDVASIVDAPPAQRKLTAKRTRLEVDLARLGENLTDVELGLLIHIGKVLRGTRRS
jgi:transcriptional regulator with XRE-family HTH domain